MSAEIFLKGRVQLCCGDSLHFLRDQPDGRYDSVVTDPPYALDFMGKKWDTGETAFAVEFWENVLRVLKPGGHVVAFGGTRTYHRLTCAIEDAGFEIRDQLQWIYGSGFPKSHNVGIAIDRHFDAEREVIGQKKNNKADSGLQTYAALGAFQQTAYSDLTAPSTPQAAEWQGWGTALKPACEPIVLARKPLSQGTVAANVLKHGTGAINVDGCRIGDGDDRSAGGLARTPSMFQRPGAQEVRPTGGRWPANIIHDGSDEVTAAFPETTSGTFSGYRNEPKTNGVYGSFELRDEAGHVGDSGSAARFFYTAKADADDRLGSKHPTVKPVDLMQWLVRLVTPKGGLVLDPFAGTGTTAEACFREGMRCMLVERETEYQTDIRRRMALVLAGPDERSRESIKAKTNGHPIDHGPLFSQTL